MPRKYTEIVGIEQLEDVLNKLPLKVQGKVLLSTTRVPSKELLQDLRSSLRAANRLTKGAEGVDMDELIETWKLKSSRTWRQGYVTGFRSLYDQKTADRHYAKYMPDRSKALWAIRGPLWMELGSTGVGRAGKWRGIRYRPIRGLGWMRRVIDRNLVRVQRRFKKDMHKKLNQYMDLYIRRNKIAW